MWPSGLRRIRHLYTIGTLVVQYFLPLAVIAVLYLLVFRRVSASRKQTGRRRVVSKTNRMLVAVVGVFAVAWTPYQLFSVVSEFRPSLVRGPYFKFADLMLRVFAMASSGVNPVLYGWLNTNFRSAFVGCLRRRKPVFLGSASVVIGTASPSTANGRNHQQQQHRGPTTADTCADRNHAVVCLNELVAGSMKCDADSTYAV